MTTNSGNASRSWLQTLDWLGTGTTSDGEPGAGPAITIMIDEFPALLAQAKAADPGTTSTELLHLIATGRSQLRPGTPGGR